MKEFDGSASMPAVIGIDVGKIDKLSSENLSLDKRDLLTYIRYAILERLGRESAVVACSTIDVETANLFLNDEMMCLGEPGDLLPYALRYVVTTLVPTSMLDRSTYEIADHFANGGKVKFVVGG